MPNLAHIAETAFLLLLAYAVGAVIGFSVRRLRPRLARRSAVAGGVALPATEQVAGPSTDTREIVDQSPTTTPDASPPAGDVVAAPMTVPSEPQPEVPMQAEALPAPSDEVPPAMATALVVEADRPAPEPDHGTGPVVALPQTDIADPEPPAEKTVVAIADAAPVFPAIPPRSPARTVGELFIQIESDLAGEAEPVSDADARLDIPAASARLVPTGPSPVEQVLAELAVEGPDAEGVEPGTTAASQHAPADVVNADAGPGLPTSTSDATATSEVERPTGPDDTAAAGAVIAAEMVSTISPDEAEAAAMLAVEGAAPARRRRRPPVQAPAEGNSEKPVTP